MSKRTLVVLCASIVGLVSIFMPWFSFLGFSINAIGEQFQDGYFIGAFFLIIIAGTLYNEFTNKMGKKITIATIVLALITAIVSILNIVANQNFLELGGSIGMGAYLSILSSVFIVIYTLYCSKIAPKDIEFNIDKEEVLNMAKTSVDVIKAATSVAGKITGTVVNDVKKELQNIKEQKDDDSSEK